MALNITKNIGESTEYSHFHIYIVTLSQNSDFYLAIVNLQYFTLLIKSHNSNIGLNCEIKRSQLLFLLHLLYSVTEACMVTKGHVYWSCC